jgi:hypothetical protein
MSGFFPWNFRAGKSASGGIEATGCPLEDHPNWSIVAGTGPSNLCWDSMDGKSVLVNADSDDLINIAYRNTSMISGSIAATIAMVSSSDQDWMLPLAARMINGNNLIGARWNDSQFEVVQRRIGTWSTLFAGGPVPALGDRVIFLLSSKFWKLIVNGAVVGEGETTLAESTGFWGMSQHRSPGFVGHRLFRDYEITDTSLAKTPCMTGPDTPYGEVSASSAFETTFPAWMGMNCTTVDFNDCWASITGEPMPQWIQWIGPAGQPAMVPDRLHIEARNDTNNTSRGPESITLQGSNDNGQLWDDIQSWTGLDFGNTPVWDAAVTGANAYMAIRLQVDNIRDAGAYCQIGTFTVYGHEKDLETVKHNGNIVTYNSEPVYVRR